MTSIIRRICSFTCLLILSCCSHQKTASNINLDASLPESFEYSPKNMRVITTFIDKQDSTMSTLYGGSLTQDTLSHKQLVLITWKQQADRHWFGANIPGDLETVEVLETELNADSLIHNYKLFSGKKLVPIADTLHRSERIQFILNLKPAVMP